LEIPRGKGVLKAKIVQAKYEAKLESLEGGAKQKNLLWGEKRYFLVLHIIHGTTGFFLEFIVWGRSPEWPKATSFLGGSGGMPSRKFLK